VAAAISVAHSISFGIFSPVKSSERGQVI
jgi:hypothetical protein